MHSIISTSDGCITTNILFYPSYGEFQWVPKAILNPMQNALTAHQCIMAIVCFTSLQDHGHGGTALSTVCLAQSYCQYQLILLGDEWSLRHHITLTHNSTRTCTDTYAYTQTYYLYKYIPISLTSQLIYSKSRLFWVPKEKHLYYCSRFLQAKSPSYHRTNNNKALKEHMHYIIKLESLNSTQDAEYCMPPPV